MPLEVQCSVLSGAKLEVRAAGSGEELVVDFMENP
jgi:hypothetical protein